MVTLFLLCLAFAPSPEDLSQQDSSQQLSKARDLYNHTDYDGALAVLRTLATKDGEAHFLTGESLFHKEDFKAAADAYEKAVAQNPSRSNYHHGLGKAYGRQAEIANPLFAARLAVKTRQEFEKAVALDPANKEAMNDLLEYYLDAPSVLGGGMNKAEDLAPRIAKLDAAEGHYARAQIALKRKDPSTAEREFRAAVEAAPKQSGRLLDLARFLEKQGKIQDSDHWYAQAMKLGEPKAGFARAESYLRQNRNFNEAAVLLDRYLASTIGPEDPPRAKALELLGKARPRNAQSQ